MVVRISHWIELGFWQAAVRLLTGVRPLATGFEQVAGTIEAQPALRFLPRGWMIALAGWALGLTLGILIATWWF